MPTENKIDCPAFYKRSASYPFGDRVPCTVRMLVTATADKIPGVELSHYPEAKAGQTYRVWTNSHGAVVAVMDDGNRLGLRPAEFEVDSWHHLAAEPYAQPHPEPIAWTVGTAFWWTKEEAERDAQAAGLPVVAIGPMPTRQDEPAWFMTEGGVSAMHAKAKAMSAQQGLDTSSYCVPLYTHADPGEVERLRLERRRMDQALSACANERDTLRTLLVEALAFLDEAYKHDIGTQLKREIKAFYLSASAEPSAPVAQA